MWLILTALSSIMLMATTNQLCLDVAVIPLLWLLPMGLYLLSFILCFHSERWYSRLGFGIALAAALAQTCVVLSEGIYIGLQFQIISYCFTLFVCCMVCHGELVRLKPGPPAFDLVLPGDLRWRSLRWNFCEFDCAALV